MTPPAKAFLVATTPTEIPNGETNFKGITTDALTSAFRDMSGGAGVMATEKTGTLARRLGLAPTLKEIEELKNVTGEYCDVSTFVAFCKDVGLLLRQIRGRLLLCERSAPQNRPAHTRVSPQVVHAEDSPAKFVALFQPYDLECSGKVPMKLFKSLLLNCGEVLSEEELDAVLSRLGLDGSPLIDYREFCVK